MRQRVSGIPRFVTTRGGAYFFLPGLTALTYLASMHALLRPQTMVSAECDLARLINNALEGCCVSAAARSLLARRL